MYPNPLSNNNAYFSGPFSLRRVNFKKNEKNYNSESSEVFKMVQEADKDPKSPEPGMSHNLHFFAPDRGSIKETKLSNLCV